MTQDQINLVKSGFGHMVDNGYGKLETIEQVILTLEVSLDRARREKQISAMSGEANPGADTVIMFLDPTIANLKGRTGR